jgi:hypothetical protein
MTTLTKTQLQQLKAYCDWAESEGVYYGNQAQFIARHNAIVKWLQEQLK